MITWCLKYILWKINHFTHLERFWTKIRSNIKKITDFYSLIMYRCLSSNNRHTSFMIFSIKISTNTPFSYLKYYWMHLPMSLISLKVQQTSEIVVEHKKVSELLIELPRNLAIIIATCSGEGISAQVSCRFEPF